MRCRGRSTVGGLAGLQEAGGQVELGLVIMMDPEAIITVAFAHRALSREGP
jgi:hypothetical protein